MRIFPRLKYVLNLNIIITINFLFFLDIKKQFVVTPKSQLVKQYNSANFLCEPPPAAPFAQVYWLKNGAPIVANDNIQISKEGHLFIKQASLLVCIKNKFNYLLM